MIDLYLSAETISELKTKIYALLEEIEPKTIEGEVVTEDSEPNTPPAPKKRARKSNAEPQAATPAQDSVAPMTGQSAPEGSAPNTGKIPSYDEVRAAGARYLEKTGETAASCPKFLELLISFGVDRVSAIPENRRAEFIARCDA